VLAVVPALQGEPQEVPRFRSGIDLINVTATVTDGDRRFARDLRKEDFSIFEDGRLQALLVISDGNDTRSVVTLTDLRRAILESDVLVYALGSDNPAGARQKSERVDVRDRRMKVRARPGFIAS
jgi:hypothetical protein